MQDGFASLDSIMSRVMECDLRGHARTHCTVVYVRNIALMASCQVRDIRRAEFDSKELSPFLKARACCQQTMLTLTMHTLPFNPNRAHSSYAHLTPTPTCSGCAHSQTCRDAPSLPPHCPGMAGNRAGMVMIVGDGGGSVFVVVMLMRVVQASVSRS